VVEIYRQYLQPLPYQTRLPVHIYIIFYITYNLRRIYLFYIFINIKLYNFIIVILKTI
jgi:hypothetical protein